MALHKHPRGKRPSTPAGTRPARVTRPTRQRPARGARTTVRPVRKGTVRRRK